MEITKFNPLNVSSKFGICGLPIRVDTYKSCSFGCKYCFANNREIMKTSDTLQIGDIKAVKNKLGKIFDGGKATEGNLLETLISKRITWHCGGMSDPFQPAEGRYHITSELIDVCNEYGISILFSTKSDTVYDCNIRPELHSFQLSVTNTQNSTLEPNVPDIAKRYDFYRRLKDCGFKVGIRIQPFIPGVTSTDIINMFRDADNITIEGIKLVPQNKEQRDYILKLLDLDVNDFTLKGLLMMKPELRLELYKPFIEKLVKFGIPFSVADNDLRYIGTNKCCCGDRLVTRASDIDTTSMIKKYGIGYTLDDVLGEVEKSGIGDCKCNQLVASNRQSGFKTVSEFYKLKFNQSTSPVSPLFQKFVAVKTQNTDIEKEIAA